MARWSLVSVFSETRMSGVIWVIFDIFILKVCRKLYILKILSNIRRKELETYSYSRSTTTQITLIPT